MSTIFISGSAGESSKRKSEVEPKSAAKKNRKEGFARGLEAERIIGATDASGKFNVS